ncbi:hypothetical protein AX769_15595 [Frondihabitans sp. PAMC 28766]|uniref:outer membrane protein assembly factor BamB family protein n=1 Tax=Frondihabitans sp. PAMC 28766 TaxID=1795630 RepID=UPI00078CDC30|nr:PQQ-binding-like beta-propeller repeat protein [Frondihabitans sp. PAMC 28766]AMM21292.1 hypothetical protein AX769_15595 [Frondihabitans sp. PAMC 28766]
MDARAAPPPPPLPAKRVFVGLVALGLAIAVVAVVGTSLTPVYGDLAPWRSTPVADLRTSPTTTGWTTDLAREVLPGVPVRCAGFTSQQTTGRYVVVTGTPPPLGSTTACSALSVSQVQSTIALLDTDTGRVVWTRDLAASFPTLAGPVAVDGEQVLPEASRVLVQLTVADHAALASLSMTTGDVTSSIELPSGAANSVPLVEGTLAMYSSTAAREGSTRWILADVRTIDQPRWEGLLPDATPPVLTDRAGFAEVSGRSSIIDGSTGHVHRLGDGSVSLSSAIVDDAGLVTTQTEPSGIVISGWSARGLRLWTRAGVGALSGTSRDCVLVVLPGTTRGTCIDQVTGRTRWTTDVGNGAFALGIAGQTNDAMMVYRDKGDQTEIDVFDGRTGRLLYPIDFAPVTYSALASRTTGYLELFSDSGSPTGIGAFDMTSGRELWHLDEAETRDTLFWGGQLVRVSASGVATQLVDRSRTVLRE